MSSGLFLNLADGEKIVVAFLGAPLAIQKVFIDGKGRPFTEKWAVQGKKPVTRVRINVWDGYSVRIWETSVAVFRQVLALRDGDKNFADNFYSISRTGAGKGTQYKIQFVAEMDDVTKCRTKTLPLHGLELRDDTEEPRQRTFRSPEKAPAPVLSQPPIELCEEDDAPPAEADPYSRPVTRGDLEELARELPTEMVTPHLASFGVKKVSEVPENCIGAIYNKLAAEAILGLGR